MTDVTRAHDTHLITYLFRCRFTPLFRSLLAPLLRPPATPGLSGLSALLAQELPERLEQRADDVGEGLQQLSQRVLLTARPSPASLPPWRGREISSRPLSSWTAHLLLHPATLLDHHGPALRLRDVGALGLHHFAADIIRDWLMGKGRAQRATSDIREFQSSYSFTF